MHVLPNTEGINIFLHIRRIITNIAYTVAITFFLSVYAFGVRFKIVA